MCRGRGGSGAELSVASPGSDGSLVGQAASRGATLPETLDGPSLDSSSAGHGALTRRNSGGRGTADREESLKRAPRTTKGHNVEEQVEKYYC